MKGLNTLIPPENLIFICNCPACTARTARCEYCEYREHRCLLEPIPTPSAGFTGLVLTCINSAPLTKLLPDTAISDKATTGQ